jgi:hypothetical protein
MIMYLQFFLELHICSFPSIFMCLCQWNFFWCAWVFVVASCGTGVRTEGLHLEPLHLSFFYDVFFWDRVLRIFAWSGFEPWSSWSPTSWVARIIGVSHWCPACLSSYITKEENEKLQLSAAMLLNCSVLLLTRPNQKSWSATTDEWRKCSVCIHSKVLSSHKEECNYVICNKMYRTGDHHIEWNNPLSEKMNTACFHLYEEVRPKNDNYDDDMTWL